MRTVTNSRVVGIDYTAQPVPVNSSLVMLAMLLSGVVATMAYPTTAHSALTHWESTPYVFQIWLVSDPSSKSTLSERFAAQAADYLEGYVSGVAGPAWQIQLDWIPPALGECLRDLDVSRWNLSDRLLTQNAEPVDKIVLVEVLTHRMGFSIKVRQLDVATRIWNPPWQSIQTDSRALSATVATGLVKTFSPVVRIQGAQNNLVKVVPRAELVLDPNKPMISLGVGHLLRPVSRRNDRLGRVKPDGIKPLPWSVLEVIENKLPTGVICKSHSGVSFPFPLRRSRHIEHYAVAINPLLEQTVLRFVARGNPSSPLPGLGVYKTSGGSDPDVGQITKVGTTDWQGEISLSRDGLQTVYVQAGHRVLARFPLIPGEQKMLTVPIPDDVVRIDAEAYLTGVQDRLVDSIALREILAHRITQALEAGDVDTARVLFRSFSELPTRDELLSEVRTKRRAFQSSDRIVQRRIDQIFQDTRRSIQNSVEGLSGDHLREAIQGREAR